MSKREAARRAGISEGRWRQVVVGVQKVGGGLTVPVNPRRETVVAMARAVGADIAEALRLAGMEPGNEFDVGGPEPDVDDEIRYERPDGISDAEWETRKRTAQATLRALFEEYEQ